MCGKNTALVPVLSPTSFPLARRVQVEDHIQCLSELPGGGFALPVLTHLSDMYRLGVETAVEEFLRLHQDSQTSLEERGKGPH